MNLIDYIDYIELLMPVLLVIVTGLWLYLTYRFIAYMSAVRPHEVYAIWLIISFFFTAFLGAGLIAKYYGVQLKEVCGAYTEECGKLIHMLTYFPDELKLVGAFAALTLIPQLLAYLFSALTGAASAPRYVQRIQQIAMWSIIKFVASLGGLSTALLIVNVERFSLETVRDSSLVVYSFWLASFYVFIEENFRSMIVRSLRDGKWSLFARAVVFIH